MSTCLCTSARLKGIESDRPRDIISCPAASQHDELILIIASARRKSSLKCLAHTAQATKCEHFVDETIIVVAVCSFKDDSVFGRRNQCLIRGGGSEQLRCKHKLVCTMRDACPVCGIRQSGSRSGGRVNSQIMSSASDQSSRPPYFLFYMTGVLLISAQVLTGSLAWQDAALVTAENSLCDK